MPSQLLDDRAVREGPAHGRAGVDLEGREPYAQPHRREEAAKDREGEEAREVRETYAAGERAQEADQKHPEGVQRRERGEEGRGVVVVVFGIAPPPPPPCGGLMWTRASSTSTAICARKGAMNMSRQGYSAG